MATLIFEDMAKDAQAAFPAGLDSHLPQWPIVRVLMPDWFSPDSWGVELCANEESAGIVGLAVYDRRNGSWRIHT